MPVDNALSELKVVMAEMRGAVTTDLKHLSHDVKNLTMALTQFVPRQEIEKQNASNHERLKKIEEAGDIDDRLKKLESNQTWFVRQALAQWFAGTIVGATVIKRFM